MKRLFLAALLAPTLLWAATAPAAAQRSGVYEVTGRNLDGSEYRGLLELRQVGLTSFHLVWNIGRETIEGVGMVSGRTFATAFTAGNMTGMGIYELRDGDVMEGSWTLMGAQGNGSETLRPATETPPPGITPGVTPGTQAPAPSRP
ncbi:hypothetical protein [Roseococcus suduntuyensis]|uniref:Uncharacterized protein n=1 Tax=Roseococcus suduntuyensis TaxID=455361 RepID=A0A840AGI0_9PROT|nr:hypothetical protein [Roseococcus suduntuyensis]MBB3899653.1 hypothetical protein [Roseococcus suduntuyensis]